MDKKPDWIRARISIGKNFNDTKNLANFYNINTVCVEAKCPNISECWNKKHLAIMIMGSICTRNCRFCNVATGVPNKLDENEPERVAKLIFDTKQKHVVITSVDRDDLEDGGAMHFAKCIQKIREKNPNTTIEILTPDFLRKENAIEQILRHPPDVFNHNIETVARLHTYIRPGARYFNSLNLLYTVKKFNKKIFTKSGLMVGLGETKEEILQLMDDLRAARVDFLTIGQYLQPTKKHAKVHRYVEPAEFKYYEQIAKNKGFSMVSASPLTRSSYHADDDFVQLKQNISTQSI